MLKLRLIRLPQSVLLRRAALTYLIVWVLSPPLIYGTTWRVLAVMAMLLWMALDTLASRSVLLRPNWPVLGATVFVIYTAFIEWLVPDSSAINRQFPIWIMLFFLMVGESQRRGRSDEAQFCFWVILLVLPVWSIATLWGINTIAADVSRTIARSSDEARELAAQGIGGYGYVYTLVLCLPFLAQLAFRSAKVVGASQPRWKRRLKRLLIWGNFLLAALLVLRAGYSIALILSALALASIFLIRSRRPLQLVISICVVCMLVLTASIAIGPVLSSLESVAGGTEYATKVRDIRASLKDEESTGTVAARTERYSRSLKLFVENPVIGTLTFDSVGKHSAVIDRFAQYGFAFGLLFLALLTYVPLSVLRTSGGPVGLSMAFLVVAIGFPMTNNVFMTWGLVLYVFSRGALEVMGVSMDRGGRRPVARGIPAHA